VPGVPMEEQSTSTVRDSLSQAHTLSLSLLSYSLIQSILHTGDPYAYIYLSLIPPPLSPFSAVQSIGRSALLCSIFAKREVGGGWEGEKV
jgi:hypothetical protein